MTQLLFRDFTSNTHKALQELLDLPIGVIEEAVNAARAEEGYHRYELPKGDGRVRVIHAPCEVLKSAQRAVLDRILNQISVTPFAHGFAPNRSIITNALVHAPSARSVLNVDLKDAFPSVTEHRAGDIIQWRIGSLLKLHTSYLNATERASVCQVITQLCTRDNALPQGAPTSGYLLNLACARLDRQLYGVALRSGLPQVKYTRYADDLTITSSSREQIPPELIERVRRAVMTSGFRVNPRKLHTHTDTQRAIVICGVRIANGALALPKETLRRYRAQLISVARTHPSELSSEIKQETLGILSFLRSIYPAPPNLLIKPLNALLDMHQDVVGGNPWLFAPRVQPITRYAHFTYQQGQSPQ